MAIDKELFYASHGLKYPVVARQYTDDMQVKEKIYTKDEVVAMLTELRQEIDIMSDTVVEGRTTTITSWKGMRERICKLIQSKIDKLREKEQEQTAKNCESCRYYGSHHEVCNYCYKCSLWTQGEPTTKNDLVLIHTEGLDEEIRCTMCTNQMKSDRGCDGSCVVNKDMYKAVMDAIEKRIQPTTKNDLGVEHHKQNIQAYAHDFGVSEEQAEKELRVTTKNDLGVDWESCKDADGNSLDYLILNVLQNNFDCGDAYGYTVADKIIGLLSSVTPQEPFKPMVEIDLDYVIKQKYIEREVLDKIRAEIEQLSTTICTETRRIYIDADDFKENVLAIFDKYKADTEKA